MVLVNRKYQTKYQVACIVADSRQHIASSEYQVACSVASNVQHISSITIANSKSENLFLHIYKYTSFLYVAFCLNIFLHPFSYSYIPSRDCFSHVSRFLFVLYRCHSPSPSLCLNILQPTMYVWGMYTCALCSFRS